MARCSDRCWTSSTRLPLFNVIERHRIYVRQYADDIQLYLCVPPAEAADRLGACLLDVEAWLKPSQLRLNPSKTRVMWLGSAQQLAKVRLEEILELLSRVSVVHAARNLGIVVDNQMSMSAVCRGGYYHLRQLRQLIRCMTDDAIKTCKCKI
jgi:hypothetical protein